MSHHRPIDGDQPDDLSYEDFDDVWADPDDDLDVIDLDALDDDIDTESDADSTEDAPALDPVTEPLFDTLETLDDAIEPLADRDESSSTEADADTDNLAADTDEEPHEKAVGESNEAADQEPTPEPTADAADLAARDAVANTVDKTIADDADTNVDAADDTAEDSDDDGDDDDAPVPDADTARDDTSPPPPILPAVASAAAAPDSTPDSDGEDITEPAPPPPDWVYHVLIALPEELSVQVLELRTAGEIDDMPPPGIALAGSFRTENLDGVQRELDRWARNHLPLQLEITGVLAEVVGQQQYVAAWLLQPEEDLHEGQHALRRALAPLIQPLPDTRMAFHVHLSIGDSVPPRRYPHLIGQMQRDFEPYVWHATDLILVRKDADADAGAWEITQRYD